MNMATQMANREVCDLIFREFSTGKPFLFLDYANTNTTELTGETVYAYGGKGHPRKVAFDGERGGTMTIETQISSIKLWELITGGKRTNTAKYYVRSVLPVSTNSVTLPETPIDGTVVVFKVDDDCGTAIEASAEDTTVTITGEIGEEKEVIVYYMKEVTDKVHRINITSTSFPRDFIVEGLTYMKTTDDEILNYRIIAHKLHPQSTLTLTFANNGDPGTITITCDLLVDNDGNLLDLILEEEDEGN